jgi:hypothetical protein
MSEYRVTHSQRAGFIDAVLESRQRAILPVPHEVWQLPFGSPYRTALHVAGLSGFDWLAPFPVAIKSGRIRIRTGGRALALKSSDESLAIGGCPGVSVENCGESNCMRLPIGIRLTTESAMREIGMGESSTGICRNRRSGTDSISRFLQCGSRISFVPVGFLLSRLRPEFMMRRERAGLGARAKEGALAGAEARSVLEADCGMSEFMP